MNSLRQLSCWQSLDVAVADVEENDGERVIDGELETTGEVLDPEPFDVEDVTEEMAPPPALDVGPPGSDWEFELLSTEDDPRPIE